MPSIESYLYILSIIKVITTGYYDFFNIIRYKLIFLKYRKSNNNY